MLQHLITFVHGLLCFSIVALVLLQRGKGADAGADVTAECSGSTPGLTTALNNTRRRGSVVQTGLHTKPATIDAM